MGIEQSTYPPFLAMTILELHQIDNQNTVCLRMIASADLFFLRGFLGKSKIAILFCGRGPFIPCIWFGPTPPRGWWGRGKFEISNGKGGRYAPHLKGIFKTISTPQTAPRYNLPIKNYSANCRTLQMITILNFKD